ncbi:hypothetical protein [Streptomyces chumphonensis]|uniref:hypothetical protein n=1 Tax=Streptomyces chumphonensis TaxID=1214925 RepID=UPI003D742F68
MASRWGAGGGPRRGGGPGGLTAAAWAAVTLLLLAVVLTGCAAGDGVRIEESASAAEDTPAEASPLPAATPSPAPETEAEAPTPPSPGATRETDVPTAGAPVSPPGASGEVEIVSLLRADRAVSPAVKRRLEPCEAEEWPITFSFGELTDGPAEDLVVNVSACADGKGVGSYVYREEAERWVNVFADEEPTVFAEVTEGALRVHTQIYLDTDPTCCPSGEDVATYVWRDDGFAEQDRTYQEYPTATQEGRPDGEG